MIHHILLPCSTVSALWEIIFNLVGVQWVFPKTVKEAITSWKGSFVGGKEEKEGLEIFSIICFLVCLERKESCSC